MRFYIALSYPDADTSNPTSIGPVDIEKQQIGDAPRCEDCSSIIGMLAWLPPFEVQVETHGEGYGDFLVSSGGDLFVSEKLKDICISSGFHGIGRYTHVEVLQYVESRPVREEPPSYYHVDVSYGSAAIDVCASGIEYDSKPTCSTCRSGVIRSWKRVVVEDGTWEGEDVFRARGFPGNYIVSDNFKVACEKHMISNVLFVPAARYSHDFYSK